MKLDSKVEKIIEWRESFTSLPDDYFFDLIHMYLGEIKTPYNKPKLVEDLSVILRKKENKETLISYLDKKDIKVLTAIKFIPDADIRKLEKFFVPVMEQGELYEEIASLEERLIIFSRRNKITGKSTVAINPHLEEELNPILELGNLIGEEKFSESESIKDAENAGCGRKLSPQLIAVFISYVLSHPEFCKANGSLKKKTDSELKEICGIESTEIFERLFAGMKNLALFCQSDDGKSFEPNWERLAGFCALPFKSQAVYLCVAGAGLFSRRALVSNGQTFAATLDFAKGKYFTEEKLFALAFLIKEKSGDEDFSTRRFSRILAGADSQELAENLGSAMIESMIKSAIAFGLMKLCCTKDDRPLIFTEPDAFADNCSAEKKVLSVDTGYSVTVMPGLMTGEYLELVKFLDVLRCDVTATFEINRQSAIRGFDCGYTKEKIIEALNKYSSFPVPQNLKVSLDEWWQSYNSASLFKGYVLKVSEENIYRAENNPAFKNHIMKILAPGIYLLDFTNDADAQDAMKKSGIDINGRIKSVRKDDVVQGLPAVKGTSVSFEGLGSPCKTDSPAEIKNKTSNARNLMEKFRNFLNQLETTEDQKDGLLDRIERRIIIEKEQLRPSSVRFELMEAFGMNLTGKVHVLESAIQKNCLVELEVTGKKELILGLPKTVVKNIEVPVLYLTVENKETMEAEELEIEIAKISRVKKLRNALALRKEK